MKRAILIFVLLILGASSNLLSKSADSVWANYGFFQHTENLKFSPDGNYFSGFTRIDDAFRIHPLTSNGQPLVYDVLIGSILFSLKFSNDSKSVALCFQPSGKSITISQISLTSNSESKNYQISNIIAQACIINQKFSLITGISAQGKVFTYDTKTAKLTNDFLGTKAEKAYGLAFSHSGDTLAIATDKGLFLFAALTGNEIGTIPVISASIVSIQFNPSGSLISLYSQSEGKYDIYDISKKQSIASGSTISDIHFLISGSFLTSDEGAVILHEILHDTLASYPAEYLSRFDVIEQNGKLLIAYMIFEGLGIFDFTTTKRVELATLNNSNIYYCNNGKNFFSYASSTFFDALTGKEYYQKPGTLDALRDTSMFTMYSEANKLELYDLNSKKLVKSLSVDGITQDCFMSVYDYFYYVDSVNACHIYKTDTKEEITTLNDAYPVYFSKNKKYISYMSLSENYDTTYFNVSELGGKPLLKLSSQDILGLNKYVISNDEKYIFIQWANQRIKQYSISEGKLVKEFAGTEPNIANNVINVSSDDQYLIFQTADWKIKVIDIETGSIEYVYDDYLHEASYLGISPDMNYVLAGFADASVILWKARFGTARVNETVAISENDVLIYPNPANDYIEFTAFGNTSDIDGQSKIEIFNSLGICIYSTTMSSGNRINLKEFPSGIYFLGINGNKNPIRKIFQIIR